MSEAAAIWFFMSIFAICYTWLKVAKMQAEKPAATTSANEMKFLLNGKPVNGSLELTVDGRTSNFKIVDGKIA